MTPLSELRRLAQESHKHQHGHQLGTETVLKKEKIHNKSGHTDSSSYVKGELVSFVSF